MIREPLVLATLLPLVLEGCGSDWSCGDFRTRTTWRSFVDEVALETASDAYGEIGQEDCAVLCEDPAGFRVVQVIEAVGCEVVGPDDSGTVSGIAVACSGRALVHASCKGRAHASLRRRAAGRTGSPVRTWLARAAWEEAASVGAFRRLARELAGHGAPADLVERAREAAQDEIRHARTMRRLAGTFERPRFDAERPRDLREIGVENAVEGCVRETFAALVALHQARGRSPLRPVFARIADDETRHGQWSWDLDAWLRTRVPPADLDAARASATAALVAGIGEPDAAVREVLGVPRRATGRRLARGLAEAIGVGA